MLPVKSVYTSVIYKKQEGALVLTADGLSFESEVKLYVTWHTLVKHQVSPASYPKALLKVIFKYDGDKTTNITFQLSDRDSLERIRREISQRRVNTTRSTGGDGGHQSNMDHQQTNMGSLSGKKRSYSQLQTTTAKKSDFEGNLDPTALAVTRASLLAAHPSLRQQHQHLVLETSTLSEDDFWSTHQHLLQEEYARITGLAQAGTSSLLQSHLPIAKGGRVVLGVEEMRQIFIMYPAVHKAYEEKVPLELSDEQFWRKYLESEYFHRDRGRMGSAARNHSSQDSSKDKKDSKSGLSQEQQEARAAVVGTDDLFSRYAQKIEQEEVAATEAAANATAASSLSDNLSELRGNRHQWGRKLAVGQFDLASTLETERGHLLEGPRDNHPPNQFDDGEKGLRVIQKYNRHWAMVLHPEEAVAGCNLTEIARKSAHDVLPDDKDAEANGGLDDEMRRLVDFANTPEDDANHSACRGAAEARYEPLTLKNVEAYYTGRMRRTQEEGQNGSPDEEARKRYTVFATAIAAKTQKMVKDLLSDEKSFGKLPERSFPPAKLGRELLSALTKKMASDSRTESASVEMVKKLPEDFRKRLQVYFRRSAELLRHFFALRRLESQGSSSYSQKVAKIVRGMETFYREMEGMRKEFPHTETGEMMRKMCLPIMDQLDWAFQLHREGSGGGGTGGFVTVEEIY